MGMIATFSALLAAGALTMAGRSHLRLCRMTTADEQLKHAYDQIVSEPIPEHILEQLRKLDEVE